MKRFSNILYIVGSGKNEETAFKRAVQLANDNQAKLTVVGVFEDIDRVKSTVPIADELIDKIIEQKYKQIQLLVNSISSTHLEIEIKVFTGVGFINIVQEVLKYKRDLLIKAIEQPDSFIETLLGSTDLKLLRKCPCPVWLIKAKAQEGYKQILVALSYEPNNPEIDAINLQMLTMAGSLALAEFSELHVLHAWQFQHETFLRSSRLGYTDSEVDLMIQEEEIARKKWLKNTIDQSMTEISNSTSTYLKPQLHLVKGSASRVIPEFANEIGAELVVMGTVGRSGISGYLIGNTAETILNQIDCSVLAVKPEGFITPIKFENNNLGDK